MGYINTQSSSVASSSNQAPPIPSAPQPEVKQPIKVDLDPFNPIGAAAGAIGGLFSGVVQGAVGLGNAVSGVPVIGDIGKAIAGGIGAIGEIGVKGSLQVKDVAKAGLDLAMVPGQIVQTGAAAVRASGAIGGRPQDIQNMMSGGKDFGEVVDYLVKNNRAFSDDAMTNLGFALVTDPLNYVPFGKPLTLARDAAALAKTEALVLSKADELVAASKAGRSVVAMEKELGVTLAGKSQSQMRRAALAGAITTEDAAFLNKWRIPAAAYEATVGRLGRGFGSLTSAILTPVFIGATKELRQAPKTVIDFLSKNGRPELADNMASALGRGLNQTMIFTIGKLFTRSQSSIGRARANRVLQVVAKSKELEKAGRITTTAREHAAKLLESEGLSSGHSGSVELLNKIWDQPDDVVRASVREWIDKEVGAEVRQAGAQAGGDWKEVQKAGGVRMSDSVLEASSHISEGAYKLEKLTPEFRRQLFIEKGAAAVAGNGKKHVADALAGVVSAENPEAVALLTRIWDESVAGLDAADQARYVQMMEIAAYGNQGSNAAILRTALNAIAKGDAKLLREILGREIPTKNFDELQALLKNPENAKYLRINLVKSDSLTKERLEALRDIAAAIEKGEAVPKAALASLPEEFASVVAGATDADAVAVAIASYFPDFGMIVNRAEKAVWAEMKANVEEMIQTGHYVTKASADEVAQFRKIIDMLSPGAGATALKALESGRYSLGFAPESGVKISMATKVVEDGIEYIPDAITPFIDSTANLIDDGLDLSANSFNRSGLRQMADRWLSPVSSRAIQNEQIAKTIRLAEKYGATEADGRRALARINEEALRRKLTPRAIITDENFVRKTLQDSLGPQAYAKMIDDLGDPRKFIMMMYAGGRETVGATQQLTGWLKTKAPALAFITDYAYPQLKFRYNPFFFVQEYLESPFFNRLRAIDRTLTSGEYTTKYGWMKYVPYGDNLLGSRLGEKLGLSKAVGKPIEQSFANQVLGDSTAALTADVDVASSIVALGGTQIAKLVDETAEGVAVKVGLGQAIKGGMTSIIRTIMNPYPMKIARREEAAFSMAIDSLAPRLRTEFPQQWVAMSKTYGTNNPREVLISFIRDVRQGYVNPIRVLDGHRPPSFGFSEAGSVEAATSLSNEISAVASKLAAAPDDAARIALVKAESIILKDALEKSGALGNDVSNITRLNTKLISVRSPEQASKILGEMSEMASAGVKASGESVQNYSNLLKAIKDTPELASLNLMGFTREKLASSLTGFRQYGGDFPKMAQVLKKLSDGSALDADDIRAVRFGINKLIGEHGHEELLLGALRETLKDTADAANRIHFYNPNRTSLERSINHPVLGLYPLSYMMSKVIPEFARVAFVKMPFTNKTRPFAGYEMVREIQDHLALWAETNPKEMSELLRSDALFMFKQLFPALPGDISVSGPKWLNAYLQQIERSNRPAQPGREQAQADPFYAMRALADQAASQSVYGVLKRFGGVGSEAVDYFDGPPDYNVPGN